MAAGFSPLDEVLGLLPGALTPPLQRHLSRLGTRLGFAEAAAELAALRGVTVSAATARRRTEADGAILMGLDDGVATRLAREDPVPPAGPPVQQVSVDGGLVPLVGGEWGEVKLLAIGTVPPGTVRATAVSYFGRRADAATFAELARGEVWRRGVETAGVVAGVSDGAPWCQGFLDVHRPDAVRILDFPHASQRLTTVAEAVWGPGARATAWATTQRAELRDGDPDRVLATLRALPVAAAGQAPDAVAVREETLGYLATRREQIAYAAFRARGLPIGSGMVESACKVVVAARLKGAGRRWAPANVNPMVALRGSLCSGRWDARWPEIGDARRAAARARTRQRRLARHPPVPIPAASPSLASPSLASPSPTSPVPPRRWPTHPAIGRVPRDHRPKRVIDGRPTARHPYKLTYRSSHPDPTDPPAKL